MDEFSWTGPITTGATVCVAVSGFGFYIDNKINRVLRERVYYFLRDSDGTNWPIHLQSLFDVLFSTKTWNQPSFTKSVLASCIVLTVSTIGWLMYDGSNFDLFLEDTANDPLIHVFVLAPYAICINAIGDFFSLWQTRILVTYMANTRNGGGRVVLFLVDLIFSAAIFCVGLTLGTVMFMVIWLLGGGAIGFFDEGDWFSVVYSTIIANFSEFFREGGILLSADSLYENFLGLFFVTTFFTSIWTVAFLIGVVILPVCRRLWGIFDIERFPIGTTFSVGGLVLGVATVVGGYL